MEGRTEPPEKCPLRAPRKPRRVCVCRGVCPRLWPQAEGMPDIPVGTGLFAGEHGRGSGALSRLNWDSMFSGD